MARTSKGAKSPKVATRLKQNLARLKQSYLRMQSRLSVDRADSPGRERERESGHEREGTDTDKPAPPGSGRERGGERGRGPSLPGGTHLSGRAGTRAHGLAGLAGPKSIFPFSPNL